MSTAFVVARLTGPLSLPYLPAPSERGDSLRALAEALAHSPLWPDEAVLVIREEPEPLLAVLGFFDAAAQERLGSLRFQLEHALPRLRYFDYEAVTAACQALADKLTANLGAEELASAKFVGLPRGGLIVLGILSYLLPLTPVQLEPPTEADSLVVIVDDCAFSGTRFGEFKARFEQYEVVFATLVSPPALRATVEAREPKARFLSTLDLSDRAHEILGDDYDAWVAHANEHRNPYAYRVGQQTELAAFPWNEPDLTFWNSVTERHETGWRFLSPELCLKHRHNPRRVPVYVQQAAPGPLEPAPSLLYGRLGERVLLGDLDTQHGFVLEGVAADMWEALLRHGNAKDTALELAGQYDAPLEEIEADCRDFARTLRERGLLAGES